MDERLEEQHLFNEEAGSEAVRPESRKGKSIRFARMGAMFAFVLVLGFMGGLTVGASSGGDRVLSNLPLLGDGLDATPNPELDFTDFWKVYNVLETRFVQTHASVTPATSESEIYGAIQGLVAAYGDPYTVFFPPEEAKAFQEGISGNFSGVGMEIALNKDGILTVIAPLRGTPAEKAGVLAGDLVISIDGKSTEGISTEEAVKLIRGPKGTTVTFVVARNGTTKEIKVVRDTIQVPIIEQSYDAKTGIYTIALYEFSANSARQFDAAFKEFQNSGSKKLILDMRGNPGGYLEASVRMASRFLPKGTVIVTEDYEGNRENEVHKSSGLGGLPEGAKVVVLIDKGSASASEIFAGALQDNKVATVIGTNSFGKGSVQELVEIGKASLKVTVARWLTPSGRSISDGGLTPDIKVERTAEDVAAGKDPQKERAIQFLTQGS